jgi:hypothetical protein
VRPARCGRAWACGLAPSPEGWRFHLIYWLMVVAFLGPKLPDIVFARPTVQFPTVESCTGQHIDIPAGTVIVLGMCFPHRLEATPAPAGKSPD